MADGGGRHPAEGELRSDAALVGAVIVPFLVGGLVIGVSRWVAVVGVVLPVIDAHLPFVVGGAAARRSARETGGCGGS